MEKRLDGATHGVICRLPGERLGYFGWPSVARLDDGTLIVASSGLRAEHVCPFGKTVLNTSRDNGKTWAAPRIIQDSLIDDRDAGVVNLGNGRLLVSWFRSIASRQYGIPDWLPEEEKARWAEAHAACSDEHVKDLLASWIMLSDDAGTTWGEPIPAPLSAPHGPIVLQNGDLLYFGKDFWSPDGQAVGKIAAARSRDGGLTWNVCGTVPCAPSTHLANYHEPHVVELPSGRLVGVIRIQEHSGHDLQAAGIPTFSMMQTESDDGGATWTTARPLGFHGSPPHLLRHPSGVLVLTYGYRQSHFGQRVAFSRDDGHTWEHDWILRSDGPDHDLGYPASIVLDDDSLFSVYYQKAAPGEKCSLLWSRWRLPL